MLFNNLMEGDTITTNNLISSIKRLNSDGKEHGTIKALLKNFILPETDNMAIKETQNDSNKYIYTIPVKPPISSMNERSKSINMAKQAFLNSTVNSTTSLPRSYAKKEDLHYAQIVVTTESKDTRSTGGGKAVEIIAQNIVNKVNTLPVDISPNIRKRMEPQQRKVSFKIKNASTSYRRPPVPSKTTMTITSTKVSELTKKFNNLVNESHSGPVKQSRLAKTIEDLQSASRHSASNSSTPSSTLSSSPNIKIVLRHRRGSKKRNSRKRCSSVDSIDKLILSDNSSTKIRVIRSKSDGTKIPKSPKKHLKYPDSSEQQSGSDSVDGTPTKVKNTESPKNKKLDGNVVKNVIKKFECEINAQTNSNHTLKRQTDENKSTTAPKEKPKVPERKSTLVLTKNLVVKDGIPKIKTVKPFLTIPPSNQDNIKKDHSTEIFKKRESLYDKNKYKTNYIHSDKMPLHVVEIIQEDFNETVATTKTSDEQAMTALDTDKTKKEENFYQEMNSNITPNESFLWRRKSSTQIYSDSERSLSESPYGFVSITLNETTITCLGDAAKICTRDESLITEETIESQDKNILESNVKRDSSLDFESNLVEAYNKEVLVGYTSKPKKEPVIEDDYEPLEPRDSENILVIPIKSIDRSSKINCPLPEIPKRNTPDSPQSNGKENIYQCLLEMRSHPEGDESCLHNYELCETQLEERTRGDGDSDDGYEYCKSPIKPYCLTSSSGIQIAEDYQPSDSKSNNKNYEIAKSVSGTSTVSYEKIGSDRIYEKIPARPPKSKDSSPSYSDRHSFVSDYTGYNDTDNIYDTIKHSDGASLSHCYESIPNSPSMVKLRNNLKKQLSAAQKRLSFDTVSNISQSTLSSEQKTNSIYGQRSVINYNGQEIAFQVPSSEVSVSGSDRSDDWVDVSDEEKNEEQKIIIVRERSRGRKSPVSWSQKVRHQWQKTPKQKNDDKVFVTSPTKVYIGTSAKSPHYSKNDEEASSRVTQKKEDRVRLIEAHEQRCWLTIRTVLRDGEFEIQDLIAFIECESSDSGHVYESLEPAPAPPLPAHHPHFPRHSHPSIHSHHSHPSHSHPSHNSHPSHHSHHLHSSHTPPLDDDFDSFDSDTDTEDLDNKYGHTQAAPALPASRLPSPPSGGGQYTLTKIASAAQRKMRQIKRNLTKRYSVAMDGKSFTKSSTPPQTIGNYDVPKTTIPIYANCDKPENENVYTNINFKDTRNLLIKTENPLIKINGSFKEELKTVIGEKRLSNGDIPPPLPEKLHPERTIEKPTTPTSEGGKKDAGTLSRKAYFSFKSRFRRASSLAVDINEVPSALKITNSTFYLTDSMDGDSGFSNCSDSGQPGSTETLSPTAPARRRDGRLRAGWAESSPCLALERPAVPPPPPPPPQLAPPNQPPLTHQAPNTDLSAVNEELKRLLPTLSRKDKAPRTRTSWYAECGSDTISTTTRTSTASNTSWYAEAGLYQAGNISSSSGASSGSHPASPLPHSLFTHEPLYQFYNAAKVESVCRETGDSDSDAYEVSSTGVPAAPAPEPSPPPAAPPVRPSAMALVAPRGPARTLWCEVPEVLNSTVLSSLAPAQKRLQEAKFELLTSEASYLNSLNVLEAHFIAHPAFREAHILPRAHWEALFSAILPVRKCSALLMNELEKCWQENILLQGICEIVQRHAERHFHVYVKYCEQQALMVRALQRLRERPSFSSALRRLESHPACQSLSLHSFLMLPMQRVTRLPLLLDAVLKNLAAGDLEYQSCVHALATLNHFVSQCNEGARNTERIEEMFRLSQSIEFPAAMRDPPALGPACSRRDRRPVRWLVRSGEMTQLVWKTDELKLTFGKKFHKVPLHLFLFNDLLVITKRRGENEYVAVDYCPRSLLEVCGSDGGATAAKHALLLTLLENHEGRTIEMLMSCPSETDASRWGEALCPVAEGAEGEAVYAGWDCPQVAALYAYAPAQPDELPLAEGDIVNVTRKTSEGWYYGERTRDGEAGWFPGAYTAEIASAHVRARNLRQRYRLLALSGSYLGQKKRPV